MVRHVTLGLDKTDFFEGKIVNIFLSVLTYVLGAQKNRLMEQFF